MSKEWTALPALNLFVKQIKAAGTPDLSNTVFVCVQHLLESSIDLFQALISIGANPHNIFLIGKHYSTCDNVYADLSNIGLQTQVLTPLSVLGQYDVLFKQDITKMWEKVYQHTISRYVSALVVLDDGGRCLESITKKFFDKVPVIGIEQTTAGLFNPQVLNLPVPFIDVATCAAKKYLEAKIIVNEIIEKLVDKLPPINSSVSCGVIGVGIIGKVVVKKLLELGYEVLIYDKFPQEIQSLAKVKWCNSISELIAKADYVFGCTGRDISAECNILKLVNKHKYFISCSSEDKEFLSLLRLIQQNSNLNKWPYDPLEDICYRVSDNASIHIFQGGFPINFDRSGETAHPYDIQLTRCLLFGALIQAISTLPKLQQFNINGRVMLHPLIQQFVVTNWVEKKINIDDQMLNRFNEINWIKENSGGNFEPASYLPSIFQKTLGKIFRLGEAAATEAA